jgi:hypothetical protein
MSSPHAQIVCILWRSRAMSAADGTRDHENHFMGTFGRSTCSDQSQVDKSAGNARTRLGQRNRTT